MQSMMKRPLLIAALLVVLRVIAEQLGAPEAINKIFGVTWLFFLVPIYFARKIVAANEARPYKTLFLKLVIFVALVRLMLLPVYWLAYVFQWSALRFAAEQGGVVGDEISALNGYVLIPLAAFIAWVITAPLLGTGIGALVIAWLHREQQSKPASM